MTASPAAFGGIRGESFASPVSAPEIALADDIRACPAAPGGHLMIEGVPGGGTRASLGRFRGYGLRQKARRGLDDWQTALAATRRRAAPLRRLLESGARWLGWRHPGLALPLARLARWWAPGRLAPAQAVALMTARARGWEAAAPLFDGVEGQGPSATALLAPARLGPAVDLAVPVADRSPTLDPEIARKIVVYTARFGAAPQLPPLFGMPEGLRFLCFTDAEIAQQGWEVVPTDPSPEAAARHRISAAEVLAPVAPEAEWSLYLDPDRIVVGNLHTLFTRWLLPQRFALWRHEGLGPEEMAERALLEGAPADAVLAQRAAAGAEALPQDGASCDTGVIWRRHGDPKVAETMRRWLALEAEAPGAADLSFYRLQHGGSPLRPAVLPAALGPARNNAFTARSLRQTPAPRPAPLIGGAKVPITFLYAERYHHAGITLMRGRQLSQMIAARFGDSYDVRFTSDVEAQRDRVVIVNRGAIQWHRPAVLRRLRARNIAMVSDWQDMFDLPKARLFDASMTLSLGQTVDLNRMLPEVPSFLVSHHINPHVPRCQPPMDRLRTGYYGAPFNTHLPDTLRDKVEVVEVINAGFTEADWQTHAPRFNCHWIVRKLGPEAWKPFLKAFVAARCGAVVLVTRDDMNAAHYLGDDYPFYAESSDPAELERAWTHLAASFGGAEWRKAQAIMRQVEARCSDEQVCAEFKAMIDALTK